MEQSNVPSTFGYETNYSANSKRVDSVISPILETVIARCMSCSSQVPIDRPSVYIDSKQRQRVRGDCSTCGKKVDRWYRRK